MGSLTPCVRCLVLVLTLTTAAAVSPAMSGMPLRIREPGAYRSPNGEFELFVDPSDMHGRGAASYRLSHAGEVVWAADRPYTLWDAAVTDEGEIAGYAYSNGWSGTMTGPGEKYGDFRIVILDRLGVERLSRATQREETRVPHAPRVPHARGLEIDTGADTVSVRAVTNAEAPRHELLLRFRLSTGEELEPSPAPALPNRSAPRPKTLAPTAPIPAIALEHLGEIRLTPPPPPRADGAPGCNQILLDHAGRLYLIERSAASVRVHQHRADGSRVMTFDLPEGPPGERLLHFDAVTVDGEGAIYFGTSEPWEDSAPLVRFTANGAFDGPTVTTGPALFRPGSNELWLIGRDTATLRAHDGATLARVTRRPDNRWLREIVAAAVAHDGAIAVVMEPLWREGAPPTTLCLYDRDGAPRRLFELPVLKWRWDVACNGRWAALATANEREDGASVYLLDTESGELRRWDIPPRKGDADGPSGALFPPGGREVWLAFPDGARLERCRLPG